MVCPIDGCAREVVPRDDLDTESFAFDLLFGQGREETHPRLMGADAWFDRDEAQRYELREHSVRTADDEILTLLMVTEDRMLEDWGSGMRKGFGRTGSRGSWTP